MSYPGARHNRIIAILVVVFSAAGCKANVASLDDARLIQVSLASPEDAVRYREAQERYAREMFAGASFGDGKGHIIVSFGRDQYDEYQAYGRAHPEGISARSPAAIEWPLLKLSFLSPRNLYLDQDEGSTVQVEFDWCDAAEPVRFIPGLGHPDVLWHDRFITDRRRPAIDDAIAHVPVQPYEVIFRYVYWSYDQSRQKGQSITLLPLPDDVCMAVHQYNYLRPPSLGRPLSIDKSLINDAARPLPRSLSVPNERAVSP